MMRAYILPQHGSAYTKTEPGKAPAKVQYCGAPDEELRMWSGLEMRTKSCTPDIVVDHNKNMSGVYLSDAFIIITLNSTRHFSGFQSEPASPPPTHLHAHYHGGGSQLDCITGGENPCKIPLWFTENNCLDHVYHKSVPIKCICCRLDWFFQACFVNCEFK